MRSSLALLALPLAASASSLSQFTRADDVADRLPTNCDKVYRSQIGGCVDSDFQSPSCSKACWMGLNQMTIQVMKYCANQGIKGPSIIVAFLSGTGPSQVCHKVSDDDSNQNSSSQSQQTTSSSMQSTSSISVTSTRSSATQISTSSTSSARMTTVPSSSSTSPVESTSSSSTASSTTSSTKPASQFDVSHGGSPFDISGNLQSNAARASHHSLVGLASSLVVSYLALHLL